MNENQSRAQVLIAGAGPTGLVLAIWLRKKGINVRIIDKSDRPGTTSRALAVQARTLELYNQLGIADRLIKAGIKAQEIIMRRNGQVVAKAKLGEMGKSMSPFSYLLFCSQDIHEKILCEELEKLGTIVERQTELVDFKQQSNQVIAKLKKAEGYETIYSEYMCGCDGAHSLVRHGLPADFPGGTYSQVFFVADVIAEEKFPNTGIQVSLSDEGFCIMMPIEVKDTIRLTGLVPAQSEKKSKITFDDVAESIDRDAGIKVQKVNWFSTYHVHHRVAEKFRNNRVFIAGDAGHIHSPAGGQGMNTGIGDAINLAWKLAAVLEYRASTKLLESYEPERMDFAKVLVRTTDTAFKVIASRSYLGSLFRSKILPRLFSKLTTYEFFLKLVFSTISQIRIQYRNSFLSQGRVGSIYAGDRLPWIWYPDGDNFESLKSLDWQIHVYGTVREAFKTSVKKLDLDMKEFEWNEDARDKGLLKNTIYLVRPDGYIALASENQNVEEIQNYFRNL